MTDKWVRRNIIALWDGQPYVPGSPPEVREANFAECDRIMIAFHRYQTDGKVASRRLLGMHGGGGGISDDNFRAILTQKMKDDITTHYHGKRLLAPSSSKLSSSTADRWPRRELRLRSAGTQTHSSSSGTALSWPSSKYEKNKCVIKAQLPSGLLTGAEKGGMAYRCLKWLRIRTTLSRPTSTLTRDTQRERRSTIPTTVGLLLSRSNSRYTRTFPTISSMRTPPSVTRPFTMRDPSFHILGLK